MVTSGDWNAYDDVPFAITEQAADVIRPSASMRLNALPEHLEAIERDPSAPDVADRLNEVVRALDDLGVQGDWPAVTAGAAAVIRGEERTGDADLRRSYGIAIRRMLPRSVVEQVARLVTSADQRAGAQAVLQRVGADATEALLALLAGADKMEDRRAYFASLRQMTEGTELLVNMLTHDEWFVVRNVADLCGEMRIETSVSRLARHVRHEDERVRRSVAAALARIGTSATAEPLRTLLRDPAPAVRLAVAQNLDERLRGLAMTVAVALDRERQPDLVRELLLALGRMGSNDAVKVLAKEAEPGGKLFGRKPAARRLAAVEALGTARNPAAPAALRGLAEDADPAVREAVRRALENGAA
jgi:HEAT repeat protein